MYNTKSLETKVRASREEREARHTLWRVLVTLEQHSKHLPSKISCWQPEPVHQSLATIDHLVKW